MNWVVGQRCISVAENELGMGKIVEISGKNVQVLFDSAKISRSYRKESAPLSRVLWEVGDEVLVNNEVAIISDRKKKGDGLFEYFVQLSTGLQSYTEDMAPFVNVTGPVEAKLACKSFDSLHLFNLRNLTFEMESKIRSSQLTGFLGGRLNMWPYQQYVASEIVSAIRPRFILADEVGLGKTIEACLVINHLLKSERAKRVLILTPDSLVYQWFVELKQKFALNFKTFNQETYLEEGINPFDQYPEVIVNWGLIRGSKMAHEMLLASDFDLLIVDEAHGAEKILGLELLSQLAKKIPSLLFLSGTVGKYGEESYHNLLSLIDPQKFVDLSAFKAEQENYNVVSKKVKSMILENTSLSLIKKLIDKEGPGRIFYRNTRTSLLKYDYQFAKREVSFYGHENEAKKNSWLLEFLQNKNQEKVVIIAKNKAEILFLKSIIPENVCAFHSDLAFLERDREVSRFKEMDGPKILLCTEVGSEGRNFENARHLILWDLPESPFSIWQRIGRLDRLGRKEKIRIHVPHLSMGQEMMRVDLYHRGLNIFLESPEAYLYVDEKFWTESIADYDKDPEKVVQDWALMIKRKKDEIQNHRDFLTEINSYDHAAAKKIVENIVQFSVDNDVKKYLDNVFELVGVQEDKLRSDYFDSKYIYPGDNMLLPYFPGLAAEGMMVTFNLKTALEHEKLEYLTWDHPMVRESMDLISSTGLGATTVVKRDASIYVKDFMLETFWKVNLVVGQGIDAKKFFPTKIFRILISSKGNNLSAKLTIEEVVNKTSAVEVKSIREFFKDLEKINFKELLKKSKELLTVEVDLWGENGKKNLRNFIVDENERFNGKGMDQYLLLEKEINSAYEKPQMTLTSAKVILV